VRNDLHSPSDAWSLVGDVRLAKYFQRAPQLGSDTPVDAATIDVDYDWIRLYQTAYRQVRGPFHVGLGYHLDSYLSIEPRDSATLPPEVADTFPVTTVASGVSLDALFDSRDNALNASSGLYGRASYYYNPEFLGSDRDWQSLQLEGRAYVRLPSERRQVLAAWTQSWQTVEGEPPYFNLPSVGWDTYGRTGRGYPAGRLRGKDWIYVEAEYRVDLMRNGLLGAVAFVNGDSFSDASGVYGSWAAGGGMGVRVKLNKKYGTNVAMDFAWGRDGSRGVWFGLNEAF
jgi:outer membrane protein assembly factor BamA